MKSEPEADSQAAQPSAAKIGWGRFSLIVKLNLTFGLAFLCLLAF